LNNPQQFGSELDFNPDLTLGFQFGMDPVAPTADPFMANNNAFNHGVSVVDPSRSAIDLSLIDPAFLTGMDMTMNPIMDFAAFTQLLPPSSSKIEGSSNA
jgi:hypothetical protein